MVAFDLLGVSLRNEGCEGEGHEPAAISDQIRSDSVDIRLACEYIAEFCEPASDVTGPQDDMRVRLQLSISSLFAHQAMVRPHFLQAALIGAALYLIIPISWVKDSESSCKRVTAWCLGEQWQRSASA